MTLVGDPLGSWDASDAHKPLDCLPPHHHDDQNQTWHRTLPDQAFASHQRLGPQAGNRRPLLEEIFEGYQSFNANCRLDIKLLFVIVLISQYNKYRMDEFVLWIDHEDRATLDSPAG